MRDGGRTMLVNNDLRAGKTVYQSVITSLQGEASTYLSSLELGLDIGGPLLQVGYLARDRRQVVLEGRYI